MAGIGIDFGATSWRVAVAREETCEFLPSMCWSHPRPDHLRFTADARLLSSCSRALGIETIPCSFALRPSKLELGQGYAVHTLKAGGGADYDRRESLPVVFPGGEWHSDRREAPEVGLDGNA